MEKQDKQGMNAIRSILITALIVILYASSAGAYPLIVSDSKGNDLKFLKPPQNVISLVPAASEIIFAVGAKAHVKAITHHDITLAGAYGKQVIGGFLMPSMEKIKKADPDMLILSPLHKKIIKKFQGTGCKIFIFNIDSIKGSYKNITVLGKIFNKEKEAQNIIKKNQEELSHIKHKLSGISNLEKKRVIRLMGNNSIMTPGNDSFQTQLISAAGGIPPDFGKKGNIISVTKEEWMKFNPQVIYGCGSDKAVAEKFFSKSGWKDVDAVKNRQIYYFPCALTCRASTHTGYFASWLSSMIYTDEFGKQENMVRPIAITKSKPIKIGLDYIKSAAVHYAYIDDFENKTLVIDFKQNQSIISTLEGPRDNILTVGNHYSPPPTWAPGHKMGVDHINASILKAMGKEKKSASFLMTGADMDNLSISIKTYKKIKVVALVTAGVMSNALRVSQDSGDFYEPGTINIILMTNMCLSKRAMTRAIIAATEAKTAALEDLDIRSTYSPLKYGATGTGTDNVLVVQGKGEPIQNSGGHTKMGELMAKAAYEGVMQAVLKQNKLTADRHVFQRLKERQISIFKLASSVECECINKEQNSINQVVKSVEHLLLEPEYAAFLESAMALSDGYEKGLISDFLPFNKWCLNIAGDIAKKDIKDIQDHICDKNIPVILRTALNAIFTGVLAKQDYTQKSHTTALPIPERVISLSPIITETIYLVGAQDRLIADTTYCNTPEQAKSKEKIGSVTQVNVEKIIRLCPDIVIASALTREKQIEILKKQGINVLRTDNPTTFEQMCDMTMNIGKILGKESNAKIIVEQTKKQVAKILEKTGKLEKPRVFLQIGLKPLHSANKEMFVNEYIRYGGGINIAENEASGIYSREKVIKENPQVILISTMGSSKNAGLAEKQRWMSFKGIEAVKTGRIYVLDPEMICSPTPETFVKGLKLLSSLIHPGVLL